MMIEYVPELIEAGVTSFKIEGRMKSAYYVASTVSAYRRAIDSYLSGQKDDALISRLKDELTKSATRPFSTGFYFGKPEQDTRREGNGRRYSFVGVVMEDAAGGRVRVEQRNKFNLGDTLEILSPKIQNAALKVEKIVNEQGDTQQSAPHPQQVIYLNCTLPLKKGDILRKLL
jgi:putative protease